MSDDKLDELAARYAHDDDVLDLIAETQRQRQLIRSLFDRLKLQAENYAAARQSQLKPLAKCHG